MNMEFIGIPLMLGIIFGTVYKVFELFVQRQERLKIIEKFSASGDELKLPELGSGRLGKFLSLRFGCLLLGIGLGLLVGIIVSLNIYPDGLLAERMSGRDIAQLITGASVLLFGGIGLLVSFIIEQIMSKREK